MRLAELSRRSAVSIATIKYYLRSGLLLPGRRITATEADYGEHHLHRLRLIRALIGVGHLSVSATKEILDAVTAEQDDPGAAITKALDATSAAQEPGQAKSAEGPTKSDPKARTDARTLIAEMGWCVPPSTPAVEDLDRILDVLTGLGVDIDWRTLLPYARWADEVSRLDSHQISGAADASLRAERTVVVTVLLEPALLTLRRLALEDKASRAMSRETHLPGHGLKM